MATHHGTKASISWEHINDEATEDLLKRVTAKWQELYLGTWGSRGVIKPELRVGTPAPYFVPLEYPVGKELKRYLWALTGSKEWRELVRAHGVKKPVELLLEELPDDGSWRRTRLAWTLRYKGDYLGAGPGLREVVKETGDLKHDWEVVLIHLEDALDVLAEMV